MNRIRRKPKARRRGSERTQRIAIVAAMACVAGSLVLLGRAVVTAPQPLDKVQTAARTSDDMSKAPQDEEIYTGSILFMPPSGDSCRQYLFDNLSGRLSDNGTVDCARAAYHPTSAPPKKWSAQRVHVIRDGFRDR